MAHFGLLVMQRAPNNYTFVKILQAFFLEREYFFDAGAPEASHSASWARSVAQAGSAFSLKRLCGSECSFGSHSIDAEIE